MATGTHPTRDRLIATMVALLDGSDPEHITADQVLSASGISKGSLYHHFEDFEDLIEAALVFRFSRNVDYSIEALTHILATAQTKKEFAEQLQVFNTEIQDPARSKYRLERARAAGMTVGNARFSDSLGVEQERLTMAFTDLFKEAQHKGWVREGMDPQAVGVFLQAYTIGRLVDDISPSKVSPEAWNAMVIDVLNRVFLAD